MRRKLTTGDTVGAGNSRGDAAFQLWWRQRFAQHTRNELVQSGIGIVVAELVEFREPSRPLTPRALLLRIFARQSDCQSVLYSQQKAFCTDHFDKQSPDSSTLRAMSYGP